MQLPLATAALTASFATLFTLERVFPLRAPTRPLRARLATNVCLAALAFAVAGLALRPLVGVLLPQVAAHQVGVLRWLALPPPAELALGVVLLDLSFYYWHRANHRVPVLWRLHLPHHIDADLDVTTAPRFHPGEILASLAFRAVQITALGVAPATYAAYELVFQLAVQFHHANLRLPLGVDRGLRAVIVTPRMHGVHHSQRRDETDSNYGVVLSLWDRVHGTYREREPAGAIDIGVPRYRDPATQGLGAVLALPVTARGDAFAPDDATATPPAA